MAETVQFYLEQMVPELQRLEEKGVFSKVILNAWTSISSMLMKN